MDKRNQENELILTKTNIPFLRAGKGNWLIFPFVIVVSISHTIISEERLHPNLVCFLSSILLLLFIFQYLQALSRLKFFRNKIIAISTASVKIFYIKDIEYIKIGSGNLNYTFSLSIKLRGKFFPRSYSCCIGTGKTNFGEYHKTFDRVEELLKEYGIPLKKHFDFFIFFKK